MDHQFSNYDSSVSNNSFNRIITFTDENNNNNNEGIIRSRQQQQQRYNNNCNEDRTIPNDDDDDDDETNDKNESFEPNDNNELIENYTSNQLASSKSSNNSSYYYWNYILFCICFSMNHSTGLACMAFATAKFGSRIGSIQTSILYCTYTISAIVAPTFVKRYQSKSSIVIGMLLFSIYILLGCYFYLLLFHYYEHDNKCYTNIGLSSNSTIITHSPNRTENAGGNDDDSIIVVDDNTPENICSSKIDTLLPFVAYIGAAIGGVGASICWTAQGVYYTQASEYYSMLVSTNNNNTINNNTMMPTLYDGSNRQTKEQLRTKRRRKDNATYSSIVQPTTTIIASTITTSSVAALESSSHVATYGTTALHHDTIATDHNHRIEHDDDGIITTITQQSTTISGTNQQQQQPNADVVLSKVRNEFSSLFACCILISEVVFDILATLFVQILHVHWSILYGFYSLLAILSTVVVQLFVIHYNRLSSGIPNTNDPTKDSNRPSSTDDDEIIESSSTITSPQSILHEITTLFRLLLYDPRMKYFIPYNVCFGLTGAFLNSYISGEVVSSVIGATTVGGRGNVSMVGLFVAIHGISAGLFAVLFSYLISYSTSSTRIRITNGTVHIIGCIAFGFVGLLFLLYPNSSEWTWLLVGTIYITQGIGRSTFEANLKTIFATYFSYEKEGAYANIIFQYGSASSISYYLFTSNFLYCDPNSFGTNNDSGVFSNVTMSYNTNTEQSPYCVQYRDGTYHNIGRIAKLIVVSSSIAIIGFWRASYLNNNQQHYGQRQVVYSSTMSDDEDQLDTDGTVLQRLDNIIKEQAILCSTTSNAPTTKFTVHHVSENDSPAMEHSYERSPSGVI